VTIQSENIGSSINIDDFEWEPKQMQLTNNAVTVLKKRYLIKRESGEAIETPEAMFRRVAKNIAAVDSIYNAAVDIKKLRENFIVSWLI